MIASRCHVNEQKNENKTDDGGNIDAIGDCRVKLNRFDGMYFLFSRYFIQIAKKSSINDGATTVHKSDGETKQVNTQNV